MKHWNFFFYVLFIAFSLFKPIRGRIIKHHICLEKCLQEIGCLNTFDSSSSSSSSSTFSKTLHTSPQESAKAKNRRPCLIWNVLNTGVHILPIASFINEDITKIRASHGIFSNPTFMRHLLPIKPLVLPLKTKSLEPIKLKDTAKTISGYLVLMKIFIPINDYQPSAARAYFNSEDMNYISSEFTKLAQAEEKEQNEQINQIDYSMIQANVKDDDMTSEDTSTSTSDLRQAHLFDMDDFINENEIQKWLNSSQSNLK